MSALISLSKLKRNIFTKSKVQIMSCKTSLLFKHSIFVQGKLSNQRFIIRLFHFFLSFSLFYLYQLDLVRQEASPGTGFRSSQVEEYCRGGQDLQLMVIVSSDVYDFVIAYFSVQSARFSMMKRSQGDEPDLSGSFKNII